MFDIYLLSFGPLALLIAGFVLRWAIASTRRSGAESGPSLIRVILTALAWVLMLVGLFALIGLMTHVAFLLAWFASALILASAIHRYRTAERQSLLWVLAAAADRGIPLETAARAFADERDDIIGVRAVMLAEFLEVGVPLSLALRRSRHSLPPAALLAADLGQETGTLGPSLRQVVKQLDEYEITLRWAVEKLFYLGFLVLFTAATLMFLMLKIVPVFRQIQDGIQLGTPMMMDALVDTTRIFAEDWFVFLPLIAVFAGVLVVALLYYVGFSPRNLPLIGRIWWRVDSALVLRWLAIAVRQNRSIVEFMRLLASYFPQPGLRRKLERAASRVGKGTHWCDALRRVGVIRTSDCSIFKSAERTGNLAWALDEMADSSLRRSAYRVRGFVSVAFPTVLIVFAGCVLAIITGVLFPLISLITNLS
jgi:type II secretory pathway component PulF